MVAIAAERREELLGLAHQMAEEEWDQQKQIPLTPDLIGFLDEMSRLRLRPTDPTPQALLAVAALKSEITDVIDEVLATRGLQGPGSLRESANISYLAQPSLTSTPSSRENI